MLRPRRLFPTHAVRSGRRRRRVPAACGTPERRRSAARDAIRKNTERRGRADNKAGARLSDIFHPIIRQSLKSSSRAAAGIVGRTNGPAEWRVVAGLRGLVSAPSASGRVTVFPVPVVRKTPPNSTRIETCHRAGRPTVGRSVGRSVCRSHPARIFSPRLRLMSNRAYSVFTAEHRPAARQTPAGAAAAGTCFRRSRHFGESFPPSTAPKPTSASARVRRAYARRKQRGRQEERMFGRLEP